MSSNLTNDKSSDRGRISIFDINTNDIGLTRSELELTKHTGYDEEHLRRLKYLFRQVTGPDRQTLTMEDFESTARLMCHALTESNRAHQLAERLFRAYDKNTNGLIDFEEMVEFVWTVVDAPQEEQIAGLYEALRGSTETLHRDEFIEWLTILKDDLLIDSTRDNSHSIHQRRTISLRTDDDIRREVDRCFQLTSHQLSDGFQLNEIIDYFLGSNDPLGKKVKASWNARLNRHGEKQNKKIFKFHDLKSSPGRLIKRRKDDSSNKTSSLH